MKTTLKITSAVLAVAVIVTIIILNPIVIVGAGQRGVVLNAGAVQDKILGEGIHLRIPVYQDVIKINVQTQKYENEAVAYSKDLQTASALIALNYHIDPLVVNKLYQEIGIYYEERIIAPAIQEVMKQITAKYDAQELIAQRTSVKTELKNDMIERLKPYHIITDDISIVNFDFSDAYESAIEEKQIAEQNAKKAENDLKRIQVEAQQQIETAKAQAESIRIQAEALKENVGLVDLKAVEKWDGKLPTYMMGDSVPFVNIK